MMKQFLAILAQSDVALLNDETGTFMLEWETAPLTGLPDNQVVRLTWKDQDNVPCYTYLTEEGLEAVVFNKESTFFELEDFEGDAVKLKLVAKSKVLTPDDGPAFVLIQEGGSSSELYIHAHATYTEAFADRVSCAEDGSYRTSEIIEVPADLASHPKFYEVMEQLVRATLTLDYPVVE